MVRLIDADALAKFIDYGHLNNPNEKLYSENDIREMIDMMPTIAESVKHGKWIEYPTADGMNQCSECGVLRFGESNYCPNCGARMDIDETD